MSVLKNIFLKKCIFLYILLNNNSTNQNKTKEKNKVQILHKIVAETLNKYTNIQYILLLY